MQINQNIAADLWNFSRWMTDLQQTWTRAVQQMKSWTEFQDNAHLQIRIAEGADPSTIRVVFATVHLELRMQLCKNQGKPLGLIDILEIDRFKDEEHYLGQVTYDASGMTNCQFAGSNSMANIHALPALVVTLADQVLENRAKPR